MHCDALHCTATHCNALQRTATHCNILVRWLGVSYRMIRTGVCCQDVLEDEISLMTWHVSFICDMTHTLCDMTRSYVTWRMAWARRWGTPLTNALCHIWMFERTWLIHMSCMLIHMSYGIYDSLICHVTYACARGWVLSHMNESCYSWMSHVIYIWVMSNMHEGCHVWIWHVKYEWGMSHMNELCHIHRSHVAEDLLEHVCACCLFWQLLHCNTYRGHIMRT